MRYMEEVDPKLAMAYEVDSGEMQESWVIPEPRKVVEFLKGLEQVARLAYPRQRFSKRSA